LQIFHLHGQSISFIVKVTPKAKSNKIGFFTEEAGCGGGSGRWRDGGRSGSNDGGSGGGIGHNGDVGCEGGRSGSGTNDGTRYGSGSEAGRNCSNSGTRYGSEAKHNDGTGHGSGNNDGRDDDDSTAAYLKVYVTAAPEDGKANAAVISLLAQHLGLPKSSLYITRGHTARRKTILIQGLSDAAQAVVCTKLRGLLPLTMLESTLF
jgi:uncharacterized protein YggU (UPF0235/DUF167 family)